MGKMESDAKICNCRHVTKCDKNTKNSKKSNRILVPWTNRHMVKIIKRFEVALHNIGSNKSPFYRGKAQMLLLLSFTSHQIWLCPIVGGSPTHLLHKFEKKNSGWN
jgi:hypothetical protein